MFVESQMLELKREVTEGLKKEVIAMANTSGGEIYIGIDDDGTVIGLAHAKQDMESISNMLRDNIRPDILICTSLQIVEHDEGDVIKLEVTRGPRRPYHLAAKGLKPSGVYLRHGTTVSMATEEAIRQMIIASDGTEYERMRCLNQSLTFSETTPVFDSEKLKLAKSQMRTLGMVDQDGYFTNLGLLLSDQCEHSIKCARYEGTTKLAFQDRREWTGSVIRQVNDAYAYIDLHNSRSVTFEGLTRVERSTYPEAAIREALVNAVVHRDYGYTGSILVHLFDDRIEIVSVGGLVHGLTVEDIELGVSESRNPRLANCFYKIKWIESYGTGLQRIRESYRGSEQQPSWHVSANAFVVTLPKLTFPTPHDHSPLDAWLADHADFTSRELEEYLGKSKSSVRSVLAQLVDRRIIERRGSGPKTTYHVI
ncbi:ATP-binding protein [Exiguobacterium flavidum]|uniref:ATP-binding protein n=1 Tax=Exiguobacterium flavidum TaxID=2184695 RepID=UPI001E3DF4B3|nr:ATP-binding protein [Exiguobacterium flavidum]